METSTRNGTQTRGHCLENGKDQGYPYEMKSNSFLLQFSLYLPFYKSVHFYKMEDQRKLKKERIRFHFIRITLGKTSPLWNGSNGHPVSVSEALDEGPPIPEMPTGSFLPSLPVSNIYFIFMQRITICLLELVKFCSRQLQILFSIARFSMFKFLLVLVPKLLYSSSLLVGLGLLCFSSSYLVAWLTKLISLDNSFIAQLSEIGNLFTIGAILIGICAAVIGILISSFSIILISCSFSVAILYFLPLLAHVIGLLPYILIFFAVDYDQLAFCDCVF